MDIPQLTTKQMIEVDRAMVEDLGIELIQMMENAGRCLAIVARDRFLGGDPRGRRVLVLAGSGGNGGGGLVCARRLVGWGADVAVVVTRPAEELRGIPAHQLGIVRRMGMPVTVAGGTTELPAADLVIDALIGYSLGGAPRGVAGRLVGRANAHGAPVLALDVPTGLDATSGVPREPTVRATATVTLALPKAGLRSPNAREVVGELYLADIGVPPAVYASPALGLDVGPVFASDDVIRLS